MKADEFRRKWDRIINKYKSKYKAFTVRVYFDGGYSDCTNYKIFKKNVILINDIAEALNDIFMDTPTVVMLRKVKAIRLGRKAL